MKNLRKIQTLATLFFFSLSLINPIVLVAAEGVPQQGGFFGKVKGFLAKGKTAIMGSKGEVASIKGVDRDGQLTLEFDGEEARFSPEQQRSLMTSDAPVTTKPGLFGKITGVAKKFLPKVDARVGLNSDGTQPSSVFKRATNNLKQTFNQPKWVPDPNNPGQAIRVERSNAELSQTLKGAKEITIGGGSKLIKKFSSFSKNTVNKITGDATNSVAGKGDAPAVDNMKSAANSVADNVESIGHETGEMVKQEAGNTLQKTGKFLQKTVGKGLSGIGSNAKFYARAGVENVKTSVKSGFSGQNFLLAAGITAAVGLGKQITEGGKPDLKAIAKTLVSGHFLGGFAGSVLGGATGSFFVPALSAIPVVGGVLGALAPAFGAVAGSMFGSNILGERKSFGEALRAIDWFQVAGQGAGSVIGSSLGAVLGPFGMIAGGMIGGMIGGKIAGMIATMLGRGKSLSKSEKQLLQIQSSTSSDYEGLAGSTSGSQSEESEQYSSHVQGLVQDGEGDTESGETRSSYNELTALKVRYSELMMDGKKSQAKRLLDMIKKAETKFKSSLK